MAFEAAARFLATALPWPGDPSAPEFYVNIHTIGAEKKFGMHGQAFTTVHDAVRFIDYLTRQGQDVWVCMSGQRAAEAKTNKKGRQYLKAIRLGDNAVAHRSIYLDVDVKEKGFPTIEAATAAFNKFCADAKLPPPTFGVGSGSGLHIHWCFADPIDTARWRALSSRLVNATLQHGFGPIDTGVTTDAARVLRVPDTFNHKTNPPKPATLMHEGQVYDAAYIEAALAPYPVTHAVNSSGTGAPGGIGILWPENMPPPPKGAVFTPLAPGVAKILPTLEQLVRVCPAIKNSFETGGLSDSQPLWHDMARVACFTVGQLDDFLDMSWQHPEYDEDAATAHFHRTLNDQKRGNLGWPTCQSIMNDGGACAGCPHATAGKSPFHFIEAEEKSIPADPEPDDPTNPAGINSSGITEDAAIRTSLFDGYQWRANKLVQTVKGKDGEEDGEVEVFPYYIGKVKLYRDPWRLSMWLQTDQQGLREVSFMLKLLSSTRDFSGALAEQGVVFNSVERFKRFMVSWVEKMRERRIDTVQSNNFGWTTAGGKVAAFVYGGRRYNHEGYANASSVDDGIAEMYAPTGALEPWLRASRLIYDQKRPSLDAILASSFAAPLIRFTGEQGFMLSAFSPESGMQKSTALRVAQAVWGDPVKALNSLNDTANAVNKKLGLLQHLPLYYDEIKMEEGNRRHLDMLFDLTQGKTKSRLTRSSDMQEIHTWATLVQTASNASMVNFVNNQSKTTTAAAHRVFEWQVSRGAEFTGRVSVGEAGKILSDININYGRAGEKYAEFLGKNIPMIEDRVGTAKDVIAKAVSATPEERFWVTGIAVLMLGAKFSNQLALTSIDEQALQLFLLSAFHQLRRKVSGANIDLSQADTVRERLSQYFNDCKRKTIITETMPVDRPGRPMKVVPLNIVEVMHFNELRVHVGRDDRTIRFSKVDFLNWCEKNNISGGLVLDAAVKQLGARMLRARIGAGTNINTTKEMTLEIIDNANGGTFFDYNGMGAE